jgi:hypothetical protein
VILMPIAKDQKRALMTPPVGELLAQPKPQGQLYTWGPGEPPSVNRLFIPLQICICRPSLSWDRRENCSLAPCMGGPGAVLVLSVTIYFKFLKPWSFSSSFFCPEKVKDLEMVIKLFTTVFYLITSN